MGKKKRNKKKVRDGKVPIEEVRQMNVDELINYIENKPTDIPNNNKKKKSNSNTIEGQDESGKKAKDSGR